MIGSDWIFSWADVGRQIPEGSDGERFHYALRHGTMKMGLYAPRQADPQTPHKQDELYLIATGTGVFVKDGERRTFNALDAIFVEAGAVHHFEDFTPDFSAWVVFWGPDGGE
jgi:mannose-6-phosphate isomerase-like protein (cupin superfamily)